ncbi:MAG: ribose 5-phosphate isomerase B [Opitutales bacterium]|nr:ribose 5-phosphate isomerase B [Opitutales bacterium]
MKISIGSDHAGFELKEILAEYLRQRGAEVVDCGTHSKESVDYPDFAQAVARDVAAGTSDFGVLVCWTGVGISIAASKVPGIRAVNCYNAEMAALARRHNNANVIAFGQKFIAPDDAKAWLDIFLKTEFEGGRHERRVAKLEAGCSCKPVCTE